jgi:hypothetical protein
MGEVVNENDMTRLCYSDDLIFRSLLFQNHTDTLNNESLLKVLYFDSAVFVRRLVGEEIIL